jgi:hypothetical protein
MNRLIKKARSEEELDLAKKSIDGIEKSIDNILEEYKELYNRLNTLYKKYPKLHKNIVRTVKFPDQYDIRELADMEIGLDKIDQRFKKDEDYLKQNI